MGVIILIISFVILLFLILCIKYYKEFNKNKIPFGAAMDLVSLPIVTFRCNDKKLNFILDTGCSDSIINKSVLKDIDCKYAGKSSKIAGINGAVSELNKFYTIKISYKDNIFEEDFNAMDLDNTCNLIKEESGIQVHGFLGTSFFDKYKYVIDFNELVAYSKKVNIWKK